MTYSLLLNNMLYKIKSRPNCIFAQRETPGIASFSDNRQLPPTTLTDN